MTQTPEYDALVEELGDPEPAMSKDLSVPGLTGQKVSTGKAAADGDA